ncbi:MAG: hypothetical protein HEQ22_15925 [Sphingopyxis sp.]|uniref:hypothetical protein n=1 Tax=Sphingopyxis sp. TaxID=1908224 RepID=UPI003D810A38
MRNTAMLIALAGMIAVPAAASEETVMARVPSEMSGAEIDSHNQGLAATAPGYIRCRRIEQIGSLVKKLRVCNTNLQWKRLADKGNQDARDSMEMLARGWSNSQEPQDQLMPANQPQ